MIYPAILCGGAGSRLWPLSRQLFPKQFSNFVGQESLLQNTLLRFKRDGFAEPILLSNEHHRFLVAEQMRQIDIIPETIVLEPLPRSTAPAAIIACLIAASKSEEALVLMLPSDHVIADEEAFFMAVYSAAKSAVNGHLVTFGMAAVSPHTGYGYIRRGNLLPDCNNVYAIDHFIEKPHIEKAEELFRSGDYMWNGGIFLFSARSYIEEAAKLCPEIFEVCKKSVELGIRDKDFFRLDHETFNACPSGTIDVEIMEKTNKGAVVPADIGWGDVGDWTALWDIGKKDDGENVLIGDVIAEDVNGSYLRSDGPMMAAIGLEDMVVVATQDAVLVVPKGRTGEVKKIVDRLEREGRSEHLVHLKVYRPWGWYQRTDADVGFQVKRICLNPGTRLSLQYHHHRAEHWIVVSGKARVTCGDNIFDLVVNQSAYIPIGEKHRLENLGVEPLHLIEVQSGDYLGEDDIVRLDDDYNRNK